MKAKEMIIKSAFSEEEYSVGEVEVHFAGWEHARKHFSTFFSGGKWVFRAAKNPDAVFLSEFERNHPESANRANIIKAYLSEFSSSISLYLKGDVAPHRNDILENLSLMNYYGAPDPLLDWSFSPYVALYSALSSDEVLKKPITIFCINTGVLENICREFLYSEKLRIPAEAPFGEYRRADIFDSVFDYSLKDNPGFIFPFNPTRKTISFLQRQGFFTFNGGFLKDFEYSLISMSKLCAKKNIAQPENFINKITISASASDEIMDDLFLMNITSMTLNNGIRGYAKSVKEYAKRRL
ncbi:MAG TPA: FRG domain-containing protein [Spirochaetota bacterium]|nr:FRG domain-containing protein [Spirochaetota bacterium]HQO22484.1 FRG domain-containing protein [Spirochaetota bacterium]HQQ22762.1 FRG domain-containing protein [Spirochaetota bacterium]